MSILTKILFISLFATSVAPQTSFAAFEEDFETYEEYCLSANKEDAPDVDIRSAYQEMAPKSHEISSELLDLLKEFETSVERLADKNIFNQDQVYLWFGQGYDEMSESELKLLNTVCKKNSLNGYHSLDDKGRSIIRLCPKTVNWMLSKGQQRKRVAQGLILHEFGHIPPVEKHFSDQVYNDLLVQLPYSSIAAENRSYLFQHKDELTADQLAVYVLKERPHQLDINQEVRFLCDSTAWSSPFSPNPGFRIRAMGWFFNQNL